MRRLLVCLTLSFLLMMTALPSSAQVQTTGEITGVVTDEEGNAIDGALVVVQSPALQGERRTETNDNGEFLFSLLPVGSYLVTVSARGMQTMDVSFRLKLGQSVPIDVVMPPGEGYVERIEVYAPATRLTTTANGENFNYDTWVEELPILDRTMEMVSNNAPNVVPLGECASCFLQVAGAPYFDNVVLLDGAEISDPITGSAGAYYIEDALEEIQVQTSGISARYGRFQGGVMNAISKNGSNEFTASLRLEYGNENWNRTTPLDEEQADDLNWRALATVGGFILRDHLWFFLSGWHEPDSKLASTALTGQTGMVTEEQDRLQVRIRGSIGPNHVIEAGYFARERSDSGLAQNAGDLFAQNAVDTESDMATLHYQAVLSPKLFLDAQVTKKDWQQRGVPLYPDRSFFQLYRLAEGYPIFNGYWDDPDDLRVRDNQTASTNVTAVFPTQQAGTHTLEGGIQWIRSDTGGDWSDSPTGYRLLLFDYINDFVIRDADGRPVLHSDGLVHYNLYENQGIFRRYRDLQIGTSAQIDYLAAYIHESWNVGRWRLDIGFRFESYTGEGSIGVDTVDFKAGSPRIGLTYTIVPNWQLQVSWGKYLARFNDSVANEMTGVLNAPKEIREDYVGLDLIDVTGDVIDAAVRDESNWGDVIFNSDPSLGTRVIAAGAQSPFAEDLNLSIKRALPKSRGTLELRYTHRDFRNALENFIGGDYQEVIDTDPPNGVYVDQDVWDNTDEAKRRYDAISLMWDYRPGVKWNVGGNYTWSTLRGNNTAGEGGAVASRGTSIGDYPNTLPAAATPTGNLDGDVTHRLQAWGNYRIDFGKAGLLNFGALLRYRSGDVWTRRDDLTSTWVDDPAAVGDRDWLFTYYFEELGANRFPDTWALDASWRYQIRVWKKLDAWFKLGVLNVFNNDEKFRFNTQGTAITTTGELSDPNGNPVLDGAGNPIPVKIPIGWEPGPFFGEATEVSQYQIPRTYLMTIGLAW